MLKSISCKVTDPGRFTQGKDYDVSSHYDNVVVVADDSTVISKMMHHVKTDGVYFKKHFGGNE